MNRFKYLSDWVRPAAKYYAGLVLRFKFASRASASGYIQKIELYEHLDNGDWMVRDLTEVTEPFDPITADDLDRYYEPI